MPSICSCPDQAWGSVQASREAVSAAPSLRFLLLGQRRMVTGR